MKPFSAWLSLALAPIVLVSCMPDVGQDLVPAAMEFDPTSSPARIPEPISLIINPETGLIDFSIDGLDVPETCGPDTGMSVANCEFLQYLESLDGFPTVLPTTAPASAELDMASVTLGSTLAVLDAATGAALAEEDLVIGFDTASSQLTIDAPDGWEPGSMLVFGVKGGEGGVAMADGSRVVGSPIFFLLKKQESLVCGAATAAEISEDCPYYGLFSEMGMADAEIREALMTLEPIRAGLAESGMWEALKSMAGMDRPDLAVAWSFPIHSASVMQLDPTKDLVPRVVSKREVRIGFKGEIDDATAKPWAIGTPGNIFALDLTALEATDLDNGIPKVKVTVDGQDLVLEFEADFPEGHTLGLLATTGLTNPDGKPFVPSPVAVLLRASGPLVDESGKSQVDDIADADAAELESGRGDLAQLLDDPLFAGMTGLTRKDLVYVYAFDFPKL